MVMSLMKSCGGSSMKGPSQASFCCFSTRHGRAGLDPLLHVHLDLSASFIWLEARPEKAKLRPWQHFFLNSLVKCIELWIVRYAAQQHQVHFVVQLPPGLFHLPTPKPCPH